MHMENPIELLNIVMGVLEKVSQISENLKFLSGMSGKELFDEARRHTVTLKLSFDIEQRETEQDKVNKMIREGKEKDE